MCSAMQTLDISSSQLQARFLGLLPTIERHAKLVFSDVVCADRRADAIAALKAIGIRT